MLQCMKTYVLAVQARGTVALPADLRRRLRLDGPDAQVQLIEHEDGRLSFVRSSRCRPTRRGSGHDRWQAMEREADADIAAGRMTVVEGADELIELLDA